MEKLSSSQWEKIIADGSDAFHKFQELVEAEAAGNSPLKLLPPPNLQVVKAIYAGEVSVGITVGMHTIYPTFGQALLAVPERWEFEVSERAGVAAAELLSDLLTKADLICRPTRGRMREGRDSSWWVLWDVFHPSHPKNRQR